MNEPPQTARKNRRESERRSPRSTFNVECRVGAYGLGPNIAVCLLNLSETGVCLVIKEALSLKQEVEVQIRGNGSGQDVKKLANVIWTVAEEGGHCTGFQFQGRLAYADVQRLVQP